MRPLDRAMPRGMWWICLLALCVHLPMLSGAFIFDAVAAIQESACVRGHVPVIEVLGRDFWCEDVPSQIRSWRPLPVLVWRAIWRVFPETPWPFHLASLLAHVGVTAAFVALLARLSFTPAQRQIAGVLFATLAIHVDLVASMVGLAGLLCALFSLRALHASLEPRLRATRTCGWTVLALLSHESGVLVAATLWLAAAISWMAPSQRLPRPSARLLAGVTALTLAYIGVRAAIVGVVSTDDVPFVVNPMVALGPVDRVIDAFANTGRYVALSMVPGPFSADYAFDAIPVGGGRAWSFVALGVTTTAAVVLAAVRARTTAPHLTWLGLWFLGAAAFVSNGPFLLPSIFAERMFYAATIPGCALLGLALVALVERAPRWRLPIRVTVALLVGLQTISSWYHAGRWRDEATLFEASLVAAPRNARLREFAARAAIDNNDPVRALAHLERALAIEPERVRALALHGVVLDMLGEPKRAVSSFREAMRINPTDGEPADLFIQFLLRYGHRAQARAVYETHRTSRGGTPDPGVQDPALRPRNTPTP